MKESEKKTPTKQRVTKDILSLVCITAVLAVTANSQMETSPFFMDRNCVEIASLDVRETLEVPSESEETETVVDVSEEDIKIEENQSNVEIQVADYSNEESYYTSQRNFFSSRLQIGGDYTHVNLKPKGHASFSGSLGGIQGFYDYKAENHFYAGAKFAWKQGDLSGDNGTRSLLYIDLQEKLGYTWSSDTMSSEITFFSGLGYRHLGEHLKTNEDQSIQFKYNELYVPVGIATQCEVISWIKMGLGVTWMPQVYPTVRIEPLKGARWILEDTLTNFFVELPVDFTLTANRRFHLIINPFYEHWEDGHSTAKTSQGIPLGLPGNIYNFWGADLNFSYSF